MLLRKIQTFSYEQLHLLLMLLLLILMEFYATEVLIVLYQLINHCKALKLLYQLIMIQMANYFHHQTFQSNLMKYSKLIQLHFLFHIFTYYPAIVELQDVLNTSSRLVLKTSSTRLQHNNLLFTKMSCKYVLKMS